MKTKLLLVFALLLPVTLISSCGHAATTTTPPPIAQQTSLYKVTHAVNEIQQVNTQLGQSIVQANAAKLISDANTAEILAVALKISQGGDQAAAVIQGLNDLPAGTKVNLWTVLKPVSQAVNDSLATGLIPITDQNTKASIQALLTSIQAALAVIQIQVGGQ